MDPATGKWIPLTDWIGWDDWGLTGIISLATDPIDPNRLYLAAGTYTNSWDSKNGAILRSADKGASFTAAATGLPASAQFKAAQTADGHIWLAAGTSGLWRSTNSGTSFTQLANLEEADVICFGKAATGQTYPAIYTSAKIGGVRGIYRSDDQGATWIRINRFPQKPVFMTGFLFVVNPKMFRYGKMRQMRQ